MQKEREQFREVLKGVKKHIDDGLKAFKSQVVTLKTASIVEFNKVNERISQLEQTVKTHNETKDKCIMKRLIEIKEQTKKK